MMKTQILPPHQQKSLTKEQKQVVGLLSIGTFLEYFDLMLYVHMAVLLNELFFPKTDPFTASLVAAFSFCSTYFFRPIGAIIFGWIGDNIGRKETVIITTTMMAISCLIITILPTYAQIGILASWGITICRVLQGVSSMGEMVGAEIYITETIKPPLRYPYVSLLSVFCILGGTCALGIVNLIFLFNANWRIAFIVGIVIAIIGITARKSLRETPDFVDARRRIINVFAGSDADQAKIKHSPIVQENVNKKTIISLFFIQCLAPLCFYFAYVDCVNVLKNTFHYTPEQVVHHNFLLSIGQLLGCSILAYLSYKIYPLKIVKVLLIVFFPFIILSPFLLQNVQTPLQLFLIQLFIALFSLSSEPAYPIFLIHFPIFKRFSYTGISYALSRVLIYGSTSFGLVYLIKYFGFYGILLIFIPITIGFTFGIMHFEKLEKEAGNYPHP